MAPLPVILLSTPISLMWLAGLVPSRFADRHASRFRQVVSRLAGIHLLVAIGSAVWAGTTGAWHWTLFDSPGPRSLFMSLYFDGITALMLVMVSFVGWVVCQYSIRYLDGEATQGRYFRWIALTIGAVSLMVVSGNLVLFLFAWIATSLGLHQLLLHYPQRVAAQRAAWTKFTVSRIGDVLLAAALVLIYDTFGTFELAEIFGSLSGSLPGSLSGSLSGSLPGSTVFATASPHALTAIAWLLMLGAVTKSAQFPVHTWLPETMETPTPVSALMHAGIVNAGGYLVIRMSPLISQAPSALTALAMIGTVTACFAGIVMLTQTSVKRTLAYSTIAQMGFMMLQCGLGAYSAAMLHILAHSLYKAHAFLSSGSVLQKVRATRGATLAPPTVIHRQLILVLAAGFAITCYAATSLALGFDPSAKPAGYLLAAILCLALTVWGWRILSTGTVRSVTYGLLILTGLTALYVTSYVTVDAIVAPGLPPASVQTPSWLAIAGIAVAFSLLFALHSTLVRGRRPEWLDSLYIHASNGFYVETVTRRVFTRPTTS